MINIKNLVTSFLKSFIALFLLMNIHSFSYASTSTQYQIKYHKDSPVKNISLVNIEVLIQLHRNGNSIGRVKTKTNNKNIISFDNVYGNSLIVHILSLTKDGKTTRCRGVSKPNASIIEIQCFD